MNRVLVVDDEPAVIRALGRLLRAADFEVQTASGPVEALKIMEETEFAVVFSDEKMPGWSGVDFLEICWREHPATTRILLTGFADAETAATAVNRAEIFRILWKPWDDDAVVATAREAAWRHELTRDGAAMTESPPKPNPFLADPDEG